MQEKNKNIFLLKQERKNLKTFNIITNEIIQEINKIILNIQDINLDLEKFESNLSNQSQIINNLSYENLGKINFNFTKLLISKDLRRNISHLQLLLILKRIANSTMDVGFHMYKILNREIIVLKFEKIKEFVVGIGNMVISVLREVENLIETESEEEANQILMDSSHITNSLQDYLNLLDLDFDYSEVPNKPQIKNLYSFFKIINGFETICKGLDEIARLIIYVKTGKLTED